MRVEMTQIPVREILHYLGWRGTPVDEETMKQIHADADAVLREAEPRIVIRKFPLLQDGRLAGTAFFPKGQDVNTMLKGCKEAVLMAATMGAASERLILRTQARGAAQALLMDAALSAAVEAVLDQEEKALRKTLFEQGLYLTDRFSPGYGDMPLEQTAEICEVLDASRAVGLTVSASGIMIPRKSVTAMMGVSETPVARRQRGCAGCEAREHCAFRMVDTQEG